MKLQTTRVCIISACLYGQKCRYDGKSKKLTGLDNYKKDCKLLPVCPEVLGELGVPRPRAWINSGTGKDVLDSNAKVINENGEDVTDSFVKGAFKTLDMAMTNNVKKAILKSKSPSCGVGQVRNADKLVKGNGVTAELLIRNGIEVIVV